MFLVKSTKDNVELYRSALFEKAKEEADFRCEQCGRTENFRVVKEVDVYVSSTLDEACKSG